MDTKKKKAFICTRPQKGFFLYALLGILFALPLVLPSLWILGWLAPVPVLHSEFFKDRTGDTYRRAYGRGFTFFFFFGAVVFSWFYSLYPLDFLGFDDLSSAVIVALGALGLPILQASVSSFVFVLLSFAKRRGFVKAHPILTYLFTASLFTLFEYCHTLTFLGVPWGRLAVGQMGCLANVQSASLFGSYFITFIMLFTASLLAVSTEYVKKAQSKKAFLCAILASAVFLSNLTFGAVRIATFSPSGKSVRAAAVQGNILYEEKWTDKAGHTMDVYRDLTLNAASDGADLIILPETALPYDISDSPRVINYFSDLARDADTTVLATCFESIDGKLYNTAYIVFPDGSFSNTAYKKRHLVPFGEYTPFLSVIEKVFPPLASIGALDDAVTPGDDCELFTVDGHRIGSLICFDSIYENLCLESVRDGAELICISTNDSWFSKSAALSQHNAQAVLRAIENGRYVIRSANTGISSFISPLGKTLTSLPDGEKGYILENVYYTDTTTLYTITGNLLIYVSLAFSLGVITYCIINHKKRKLNDDHCHNL